MKKAPKKSVKKKIAKISKKAAKLKANGRSLIGTAKKQLNNLKKNSIKTFKNAKDKVYATEEEMMHYVKENPVKSLSAAALVGLIAGFVSRYKK